MNQRRRFRHAGRGGELSVALKASSGIQNGRLNSLGVDFVEAEFPAHVAELLKVDEMVVLILHALSAGHRVDLEATTTALGSGEGTRVSARFALAPSSSARLLTAEMWELCNRSASIPLAFSEPIHAALNFEPARPEGFETVRILDLSTMNVIVEVQRSVASQLAILDRVRLSFELPNGETVDVGGGISEISVQDDRFLRCGVTFETTTSDYDVASHTLSSFLRARHGERLEEG